jgi:hypothetical protein
LQMFPIQILSHMAGTVVNFNIKKSPQIAVQDYKGFKFYSLMGFKLGLIVICNFFYFLLSV